MNVVPAHGPTDAKIAIVGEAPGKDENEIGIPFVGPAGALLEEVLRRANITRKLTKRYEVGYGHRVSVDSEVFVTNLIDHFPGRGVDFAKEFYADKKRITPGSELLAGYDRVAAELAKVNPNIIVPLGEHALRAVCRRYGITKWRGSILESTLLPGKKVVPAIHPAAVLREYSFKQLLIADCKRIKEESTTATISLPKRTFVIRPTLDQVLQAEQRLVAAEYCGFDIETKYNNIACVGFADSPEWAICIPLLAGQKPYWATVAEEVRVWQAINNILRCPSKKIAQNTLFDESHLACHGVRINNRWFDTMLAQNVLYPELEKSLAILTSIYTREPYYKDEGRAALKKKHEKAWDPNQADEALWKYNCKDCCCTVEAAFAQQKDMLETKLDRRTIA